MRRPLAGVASKRLIDAERRDAQRSTASSLRMWSTRASARKIGTVSTVEARRSPAGSHRSDLRRRPADRIAKDPSARDNALLKRVRTSHYGEELRFDTTVVVADEERRKRESERKAVAELGKRGRGKAAAKQQTRQRWTQPTGGDDNVKSCGSYYDSEVYDSFVFLFPRKLKPCGWKCLF